MQLHNPIGGYCDLQRVAQLQVSVVRYGLRDPESLFTIFVPGIAGDSRRLYAGGPAEP